MAPDATSVGAIRATKVPNSAFNFGYSTGVAIDKTRFIVLGASPGDVGGSSLYRLRARVYKLDPSGRPSMVADLNQGLPFPYSSAEYHFGYHDTDFRILYFQTADVGRVVAISPTQFLVPYLTTQRTFDTNHNSPHYLNMVASETQTGMLVLSLDGSQLSVNIVPLRGAASRTSGELFLPSAARLDSGVAVCCTPFLTAAEVKTPPDFLTARTRAHVERFHVGYNDISRTASTTANALNPIDIGGAVIASTGNVGSYVVITPKLKVSRAYPTGFTGDNTISFYMTRSLDKVVMFMLNPNWTLPALGVSLHRDGTHSPVDFASIPSYVNTSDGFPGGGFQDMAVRGSYYVMPVPGPGGGD